MNNNTLVVPNANIVENEKGYKMEVAAPGLDKKDFKIEVNNEILTISSEKGKRRKKRA